MRWCIALPGVGGLPTPAGHRDLIHGDTNVLTIAQPDPRVVTIKVDAIASGWEQWILLRSDAHHDNSDCDVKLEKKHLDQAKERGAGILDFGDAQDLMCGREDKRRAKHHLPPAIRESPLPYADAVLEYNASFYEPYAANWWFLGLGNHETSFETRNEISMTENLARRLRAQGSPVKVGEYEGFIRFSFVWNGTKRKSFTLWYHHGHGGGGITTKGVGQMHHQLASLMDVDFLVSGHVHYAYHFTATRKGLDHLSRPVDRNVECIRCGGYKREHQSGRGWSSERGHPPKPLVNWWLRFYLENDKIEYEIAQAK